MNTRDEAQRLLEAFRARDLQAIHRLAAQGVDINTADGGGVPPLVRAAALGDSTAVQWMLEAGADAGLASTAGETALLAAAAAGHLAVAQALVDASADLEAADSAGRTAVERARAGGYHELARWLEERLEERASRLANDSANVAAPSDPGLAGDDEEEDEEQVPLAARRGLGSLWTDEVAALILAPPDAVAEALGHHRQAAGWRSEVSDRDLGGPGLLVFRLRGHGWTMVRERHSDARMLAAGDAQALSAALDTAAIFFAFNSTAGAVSYTYFEAGNPREHFFADETDCEICDDDLEVMVGRDLTEGRGWSFESDLRQLQVAAIDDPFDFVDEFFEEKDAYLPTRQPANQTASKETLAALGLRAEDVERLDLVG